jgi:hypothetical protein
MNFADMTSAGKPSTKHKNAKRREKRKAKTEALKGLDRSIRRKISISSALPTALSLSTVKVSEDQLTSRVTLLESYPRTLEGVDAQYRILRWDGKYAFHLHAGSLLTVPVGLPSQSWIPRG